MLENWKQKIHLYIFVCYALAKSFNGKSTCCVACIKVTNLGAKKKAFKNYFLYFYIDHIIYYFFAKLDEHTYM
jgi:hypothetical protein